MKRIILLFLLSIFLIGSCNAQLIISEVQQIIEQADLDAQKSYTRSNALKGYLTACRMFMNTKESEKNCSAILTKVHNLIASENHLLAKDGAVVDSLLEETYDLYQNDIQIYLPLLESNILKSSGVSDKYKRAFELYNRAITIRTDNNLLTGSEYETLLRWYEKHLSFKKDISKEEKLAFYKTLWDLYQHNNQEKDSLDIKLLNSYYFACGLNGNEELKVHLNELKSQYLKEYVGRDSEDYLKCLQSLAGDYFSLAQKEEKKGIIDNAKIKELRARIEVWSLLKERDEIYDDNAQSTISSVVYGLVNDLNDTIQAKSLSSQYMEKIKDKYGADSKQYIAALDVMLRNYDTYDAEQIPILEEKLDLEKRYYGEDDLRSQATSTSLSLLYSMNHRMTESLAISESNARDDDYSSLMTLASSQFQYGKNREAIDTYNRLMNLCVSSPNVKGVVFFTSILGAMNCFHAMKDITGMLEFGRKWMNEDTFSLEEQLFLFTQVMGMATLPGSANDNTVSFADEFILSHNTITLDKLRLSKVLEYKASALYGMLKFDQAISVIKQILTFQDINTPQGKLNYIKYASELESCLLAKRDFESALAENEKNRTLIMSIPGYENTMEYCSMCARACLYYDMLKEYEKIGEFSKVVRLMENTQKTQLDPMATFEINNFTALLWMLTESSVVGPTLHYYCSQNKLSEAKQYVTNYIKTLEETIRFALGQLDSQSTIGQYGFMRTAHDYLIGTAMLDLRDKEIAEQAFNYIILYKQAFLESETKMREQILNSGDDAVKTKFSELQSLKNTIQTYQKAGLDTKIIQEQVTSLEKQLLEDSKAYGDFTASLNIKWQDILNRLDAKSAVIEFLSYDDLTNGKRSIGAAVLSKTTQTPILIHLGYEDSFVKDNAYTTLQYGEKVWGAIIENLGDVEKIYFSPSGVFYDIAIENLRYKEGLISDFYDLIRVSSSRQICENFISTGTSSLIFGGIDYESNIQNGQESKGLRAALSDIPYLPGTKIEAETIHSVMSQNSLNSSLYIGKDGTESVIKQLMPLETKVMHIATHGYYKQTPSKYDNLIINLYTQQREDDMLNNSGILMAGAQSAIDGEIFSEDSNDGILTAQEISTLDLRGLDLVTLSACETAKGDITGDGVFGLQRGFKKAGANSMLMSLWKVDDDATCKLMTEFYSNWIGKKMTKHKAFELAKRAVRETKGWEDPKYWAAFILLDGLD